MKRRHSLPGLLLTVSLSLILPCLRPSRAAGQASLPSGPLSGTVIYVYDGDTIKVRLESGERRTVRLIGVDSPEFDDPAEKVRLSAFLARRFAYARLYQRPVRLERDKEEEDAYGRLLAYVWTDDRTMFNEILILEGYASAYLKYPFNEGWRKRFREAEEQARRMEKGLWKKKPYDVVDAAVAGRRLGEIVTIRFRCVRTFNRSRFRVLVPSEGEFEAVIPLDVLGSFPGSLDLENRVVEVTGLVEEFRGRPQVVIGVPVQVRTGGGTKAPARARLSAWPFDSRPVLVYISFSGGFFR